MARVVDNGGISVFKATSLLAAIAASALVLLPAGPAQAAPKKCFGKKVNKVVKGNGKTVRLAYKDVPWIAGSNVKVIAKPNSTICAGAGRQVIFAGKGTSLTDAGAGNDRIVLHDKSVNSKAYGGPGNDEITGSRGHDKLYGSPVKVPSGATDNDVIDGLGGNDRIYDYGGEHNRLYGRQGSDHIYSLGTAVSQLHGDNGSDFLYSNGGEARDGSLEKLFGEQGNDRLMANQPNNNGPAYLDGGEGDDQISGTPVGDILINNSGIKKLSGEGGDDLFVTSGRGQGSFDGGSGTDTISFAAHTPSERDNSITGVKVNLSDGTAVGYSQASVNGIENVIGSAFDDRITGNPGSVNEIQGGIGDDEITAQREDSADGGLGFNECEAGKMTNCNQDSPGNSDGEGTQVDVTEGGLPIIMGSSQADEISVGYDSGSSVFRVNVAAGAFPSGLCEQVNDSGSQIDCPVNRNNLNGLLIYGDQGDDTIALESSIPGTLTTTINGGTGRNTINGGPSKDFISTTPGSAGSQIYGGDGLDVLYAQDQVSLFGGSGTDIFRVVDPCLGADTTGNSGTDSVVFAGAARGVKASLEGGYAEWNGGGCPSGRTAIAKDVEKLEGTEFDDWLIIGKRNSQQDGRSVIFGRGGIDTFDARNGSADTVTTGSGGKQNKVMADKKDTVIWGYGLAGY